MNPADEDDLEARLVWIFGSARSGSTWLLRLIAHNEHTVQLNETGIGEHLVNLRHRPRTEAGVDYFRYNDVRNDDPDYLFSDAYAHCWSPLLRRFILGRFACQVDDLAAQASNRSPSVVIKEPNGSQAADLVMSVLPKSRLIFLVRDGRDVVDSFLAANLGDSWGKYLGGGHDQKQRTRMIGHQSSLWKFQMEVVQRAYDAHDPSLRIKVHYEDLLRDTERVLNQIFSLLGHTVSESDLRTAVSAEAFDSIPDGLKGPDKPIRSATPGLWKENLTDREHSVMHEIMGEKLAELGYA